MTYALPFIAFFGFLAAAMAGMVLLPLRPVPSHILVLALYSAIVVAVLGLMLHNPAWQ